MNELPRNTILLGDAATQLAQLPEASIDCVTTSPPYYGTRNYAADGQLGLEATVDEWVESLRAVARQVARVLKPSGVFWLNLADSFSRHPSFGAPAKSLLLAPERLLLALARDGWIVRNRVVWNKPNAMPSSVRDRLTLTWEVVYFLTRSPSYFFDLDAIREPHVSQGRARLVAAEVPDGETPEWAGPLAASRSGLAAMKARGVAGHPLGKNPGDSWQIATRGYRGAHFAVFPPDLMRRPILATCPRWVCSDCGLPWGPLDRLSGPAGPRCAMAKEPRPGVVLDPFFGTGTVGFVARQLGRDWLGIELNPAYVALADERLGLARELDLEAA